MTARRSGSPLGQRWLLRGLAFVAATPVVAAPAQPTENPYDDAAAAPGPAASPAPSAPAPTGTDASGLAEAASGTDAGGAAPAAAASVSEGAGPAPSPSAEYPLQSGPLSVSSADYVTSPGAKASGHFLLPSGAVEVGGELVLMTSDYELGADRIELTDVGILRLRARRSFGRRLELFVATPLLAKQPQSVAEPVWQGARGGLLSPFGRWYAVELSTGGGPLLGRDGAHYGFDSTLRFKRPLEDHFRFELALGMATTGLDLRPRPAAPFWFEEVVTHAEAQFGDFGEGSMWLGFDYRIPFAKSPTEPVWDGHQHRALDVGTSLSLTLGGVGEIPQTNWEVFALYSLVDRGELDDASTQLPILEGGFDQQQLAFGVQYRFPNPDEDERRRRRLRRGKTDDPIVVRQDAE